MFNISTEPIEERVPYGKEGIDPAWFKFELESDEIDQIRKATNGNFALGAKRFQDEIGIMLGRCAFPGKAVRPRTKK